MSKPWKTFWQTYRFDGSISEDRLFEQVGRTVDGMPVPRADFDLAIQAIAEALDLQHDDCLFEYCCGNGLVTFELAQKVRQVIAVDFSEHLLAAAMRFHQRPNVRYCLGDALQPLSDWLAAEERPNKFLMANSLSYLEPAEFDKLLSNLCSAVGIGSFQFLLTAIPDADMKWNFYNTPERRERHIENLSSGSATRDGMGRWWTREEIARLAKRHGLSASIGTEPGTASHYRMSALLR